MTNVTPILISIKDACRLTSLSSNAILRLVAKDKFPPKIDLGTGRRFAFSREEVLEWIRLTVEANARRKAEAIAALDVEYPTAMTDEAATAILEMQNKERAV